MRQSDKCWNDFVGSPNNGRSPTGRGTPSLFERDGLLCHVHLLPLPVTDDRLESEATGPGTAFSRLALYPETGRTHQLRIHLADLGRPIIGDALYDSEKRIGFKGFNGLCLCAVGLAFTHPVSDAMVDLTIKAPW